MPAKEQGGALGESLRVLSVVTSFGAGVAPLEKKSVGGTARPRMAPPHRADFVGLLRLVRLVRRYQPDIRFSSGLLPRYFGVLGRWWLQKVARGQPEETITEAPNIRMLPLALPLAPFEELSPPPLHREELVVAWFGRLVAVKNVPLLIQIADEALPAIAGIRFLIAGDGPERFAIKRLVGRSGGRVEYFGGRPDLARVMSRADVLLQTSLDDGTPLALIQGMAAARPFLSTAAGGVPEMVTGEQRLVDKAAWFTNGVLVVPEAAAFVQVLQTFAQNRALLSELGGTGREWALTNYAETKMPEATHRLYSEYLAANGLRLPPLPPKLACEFSMTKQLTRLAEKTQISRDCATNTSSPPCNTDATAGQSVPIPPASASPSARTPDAPRSESRNRSRVGRSGAAARTSKKSGRSKRPRRAPE